MPSDGWEGERREWKAEMNPGKARQKIRVIYWKRRGGEKSRCVYKWKMNLKKNWSKKYLTTLNSGSNTRGQLPEISAGRSRLRGHSHYLDCIGLQLSRATSISPTRPWPPWTVARDDGRGRPGDLHAEGEDRRRWVRDWVVVKALITGFWVPLRMGTWIWWKLCWRRNLVFWNRGVAMGGSLRFIWQLPKVGSRWVCVFLDWFLDGFWFSLEIFLMGVYLWCMVWWWIGAFFDFGSVCQSGCLEWAETGDILFLISVCFDMELSFFLFCFWSGMLSLLFWFFVFSSLLRLFCGLISSVWNWFRRLLCWLQCMERYIACKSFLKQERMYVSSYELWWSFLNLAFEL